MDSVYRLSHLRPLPAMTGCGFPVPKYRRFRSGSYVLGTQVMPPPCIIASTLGHVLASGVPGSGCAYQRHSRAPVSGSCDSMYPGMSRSSPLTPVITWFLTLVFTIIGATEA